MFSHFIILIIQRHVRIGADARGCDEFPNCVVLADGIGDSMETGGGDGLVKMFFEGDYFGVESFEDV